MSRVALRYVYRPFVQEAKAASALNHPNIIHIYDIASEADVVFIAMEYVEGRTLDERIGRRGLSLHDTLYILLPQIKGDAYMVNVDH